MRGWRCDRCDICGNSDDEVYLPDCETCGQDICKECTYDYQVNGDGDITWAICQECSDDEVMIPEDDQAAYEKLISASNYILFVRADYEAFNAILLGPRGDLILHGEAQPLDETFQAWQVQNAKRWMDYAALEARKVVAS